MEENKCPECGSTDIAAPVVNHHCHQCGVYFSLEKDSVYSVADINAVVESFTNTSKSLKSTIEELESEKEQLKQKVDFLKNIGYKLLEDLEEILFYINVDSIIFSESLTHDGRSKMLKSEYETYHQKLKPTERKIMEIKL